MARRRAWAWLGAGLLAAVAATPYAGCNSLTHIDDYHVSCPGCIQARCGEQFTKCELDCDCNRESICYQQCATRLGNESVCNALCANVAPGNDPANKLLGCLLTYCGAVCFPAALGPPAGDAGPESVIRLPPACSGSDGGPGGLDGGGDASGDAGGAPDTAAPVTAPACAATRTGVATMLLLQEGGPGADFCIDETEVTVVQYHAFWKDTDNGKAVGGQQPECAFNTDYTPAYPPPSGIPSGTFEPLPPPLLQTPVRFVDWCDAAAYCKWAGKRLCGKVAGGSLDFNGVDLKDGSKSEWYAACANGRTAPDRYPYGPTYAPGTCIDTVASTPDGGSQVSQPVKSAPGCHGVAPPFAQVFDLSGGAAEWEDDCQAPSGGAEHCATRGGSFLDGPSTPDRLACDDGRFLQRNQNDARVGFRCCAR